MKLHVIQNEKTPLDELQIITHPVNLRVAQNINLNTDTPRIKVYDGRFNHYKLIPIHTIESIQSLDNYCQINLLNQETYLYQNRLKQLTYIEAYHFCQINHSEIIDIQAIDHFSVEKHARLALYTSSNKQYMVSRHYHKILKERLTDEKL